jgi:hypothetical protein
MCVDPFVASVCPNRCVDCARQVLWTPPLSGVAYMEIFKAPCQAAVYTGNTLATLTSRIVAGGSYRHRCDPAPAWCRRKLL